MKANQFIKSKGIEKAKHIVMGFNDGFISKNDFLDHYGFEILDDLKRLVESHDLIKRDFETIEIAKYEYMVSASYDDSQWIRVKQAILDVESCQ